MMTSATACIALPMPPSVNAIWRARRGHGGKPSFFLDRRYETWKRVCDNILLATRPKPRCEGRFIAFVTLNEAKRRGDADNRAKALFDWLQKAGVIDNDKLADSITIGWGYAPEGCRVALYAVGHEAASKTIREVA